MGDRETETFRAALESVRADLDAALRAWRDAGRADQDLVFYVDLLRAGTRRVSTTTRGELEMSIPDFDPSLPIELDRRVPGKAPAVVDIHDYVRRVFWVDLGTPLSW